MDHQLTSPHSDSFRSRIVNNTDLQQFELHVNGYTGIITYHLKGAVIELFHTEIPEPLRGNGLATMLTEHVLNYAKDNHLLIIPYCPFISHYIDQHPEWKQYIKPSPKK